MTNKAPRLNFGDRARIIKYENIFKNCYNENWSRKIFVVDFVLRTWQIMLLKDLEHATSVDTSDLASKKTLLLLKMKLIN